MIIKDQKEFSVSNYGAVSNGETICTSAIQQAIDDAFNAGGGRVIFAKGVYMTGSIYVKSNVELHIGEGVELRGVVDENAYPEIWSRVAGLEMYWPSALINICDQKNVKITGNGLINGQGEYWWNKYWGEDKQGGMCKEYSEKGLRWSVDYDCKRPRNLLVINSSKILLKKVSLIRSPFWNVHICYCDDVKVDAIKIYENYGPSTDGIDIDSSTNVIIENCSIECNDDNICVKAGRDADGLRVNRPSENIIIRNCTLGAGEGITLGSETSGGIRNVEIYNIKADGTDYGFRLKSARTRGGLIENIKIRDFEMIDVLDPFSFQLDWFPSYSYSKIPEDWNEEIPAHWNLLLEKVNPPEKGIPEFKNIEISNITAKCVIPEEVTASKRRSRSSTAFSVVAYEEKPMSNISWKNVSIETNTAGSITNAKDWIMEDVTICTLDGEYIKTKNCVNVNLQFVKLI